MPSKKPGTTCVIVVSVMLVLSLSSSLFGGADGQLVSPEAAPGIDIQASAHPGMAGPGWFAERAEPVSPEQADAILKGQRRARTTVGIAPELSGRQGKRLSSATTATPEITELARALKNDPKLIYDYVHNNIDYVPYFGSLKGATLTYLDGSGNDCDQASLLIALLRAGGYTAQYVYGTMRMPGSALANWAGVDHTWQTIGTVYPSGGIPLSNLYADGNATVGRVWVKATIGGSEYLFDPAFKTYTYATKIDIGQATGYDRAGFLATAGGTTTPGSAFVQYMNEAGIRDKLSEYSTNLVGTIRSQYPNSDLKEILGGRSVVATTLADYPTSLPFSPVVTATWDEVPAAYTATVRLQHVGIDCTLSTPDLSAKRLTLTYAGSDYHPEVRQDGTLIAQGTATTPGSKNNLTILIDHPYAANGGIYMDQNATYLPESGRSYAIVTDFGATSEALLSKRQQALDEARASGLPATSEAVLGETLNIMGLTWLKEVGLTDRLLSLLADTVAVRHHMVGLTAQEAGYYIDVKNAYSSIVSRHNTPGDSDGHFKETGLIASAFEHGMLEQLMGTANPGVSTMKLFQIANAGGGKIFAVDKNNFAAVSPQLSGYSTADLTELQNQVNEPNNFTLVLPDNGQLTSLQWRGKGYISKYFSSNKSSMGMIIGGGYHGGYASTPAVVDPPQVSQVTTINTVNTASSATAPYAVNLAVPSPASPEPVDMASGAYFLDHSDLAVGGSAPLGLSFARSYDSGLSGVKRTLGYGWTHNYDLYLTPTSHGDPGLGSRQPVDAAAVIAALFVSMDLLKSQDVIQNWMAASLVSKWAVDQLIGNAGTVHLGKKVMEFIKLADGTYAPPPGITTQLVDNGDGTFSLKERFGTEVAFNTAGKATLLKDVDGNSMTFTYDAGGNLSGVQDAVGRTLTLTYTGGVITAVSDSMGRSVSYGYDVNGNLNLFTDPEGKGWGYGYDAKHRLTTLTDPLGVTTATNAYDSLGRVKTQTVPRQGGTNAVYTFYFSGPMSMQKDPAGGTITYYFDEQGRQTGQKDEVANLSTMGYDGQNHLVEATDPRGNKTTYTYDGNHNLVKIVDALGWAVRNTYDVKFRLTDVTDPLTHKTHFGYNAKHHLTLARNAMGNEVQTTYLANGKPATRTDALGTVTAFTYDAYRNPKTSKVGSHPALTTTHDALGRLTALTDQVGSKTTFTYDNRGLVTGVTDPQLRTTSFAYDGDGRLSGKTDRRGHQLLYTYTPSGKLEKVVYPNAAQVTYTYNKRDLTAAMDDLLGHSAYTWDLAGRLTGSTDPHGFAVSYKYGKTGKVTELTYPGGNKVIYAHDALNRLSTVTNWLGQKATYTYDRVGRVTKLTHFNGMVTQFSYDDANRLLHQWNSVTDYTFTLDANGNRTQVARTEPLSATFSAAATAYGYNLKKNRLLSAGSRTFTYDNEGQLASAGPTDYTFDYDHRLTAIGSSAAFSYDGKGNRLRAVRSGAATRYIHDAAGNLLAEADGSNNILRTYIHGAGLLAMVTPSNQVYCYHFDALGSTVAMTDSSQTMVNKYAYDVFGNVKNQVETIAQPFKYVGRFGVMAEPNGFYHMRARYYDPTVGRFISQDPLGFDGGDVNLYAYVKNNPVNFVDPQGLVNWGMIGGGAVVVVNGAAQIFAGGVLCHIAFAEAESILLAPLVVHTVGLGGTLIAAGAVAGEIGMDLIIQGWKDTGSLANVSPGASGIGFANSTTPVATGAPSGMTGAISNTTTAPGK